MTTEITTAAADRLQSAVAKRNRKRQRRLQRKSYELAIGICNDIANRRPVTPELEVSLRSISMIERLQRMARTAAARGWFAARERIHEELWLVLHSLSREVNAAKSSMSHDISVKEDTTPSDVLRELTALANEFQEVDYDKDRHVLSVFTDDIELEDVFLGSFEIKLNFSYLGESLSYEVVAVDPHPAASSDSVTHPHVNGDILCEGEGDQAIKDALNAGRLFDFFVIVRQILMTYNAHSAYVSLDDWCGITCDDCDAMVNESDASRCSSCDGCTCQECNWCCSGCDENFCSDCSEACSACGDRSCTRCLTCCESCSESFCKNCLTEGECDDCIQERTSEEEAEDASADPVHAVCVGEADLSA